MARRQTNANITSCPGRSIVLFQTFPQRMSSYPDDRIYLRIKILLSPQDLYGNTVFLDFIDGIIEVLLTNERKKSDKIVAAAEHA
jgi:hypothetical protein